jgi:hypothetical protein
MNGVLIAGVQKYFMTMIDDAGVENQLEKNINSFRFNRGGEHFSNEFDLLCAEHGIIYERTSPYLPQSNGVAER